ncbi:hypothetical protein FN846DRAFT_917698, partial [Sphaerosporella brunnea]
MNPLTVVKIATTSHAATEKMLSYDNDYQRLVSERDTLKLEVQPALRGVLETSGLSAADAQRVAAIFHDATEWQPHQPAIRRACEANTDLVGITVKFMLRLIRKLNQILNDKYPLGRAPCSHQGRASAEKTALCRRAGCARRTRNALPPASNT